MKDTRDTQNKLFVGNLSYNAGIDQLKELFSTYGTVVEVSIPSDRATGRPRGFAFVVMGDEEEAKKALSADGIEILGRKIAVSTANNKKHHNDRSRGDGDNPRMGGHRRDSSRHRDDRSYGERGNNDRRNSNW